MLSITESCLGFNSQTSATKQDVSNRIKSMAFLCLHCKNPNPVTVSVLEFGNCGSGPQATAFFICPDCNSKFTIKIEDQGKFGQ